MDNNQILITPEELTAFNQATQALNNLYREYQVFSEKLQVTREMELYKLFAFKGIKIDAYDMQIQEDGGMLLIEKPKEGTSDQ